MKESLTTKERIKITQLKDGRWYAEYYNPKHIGVSGIGQFGKSPFEAEVNLQALLVAIRKKELEVKPTISITL